MWWLVQLLLFPARHFLRNLRRRVRSQEGLRGVWRVVKGQNGSSLLGYQEWIQAYDDITERDRAAMTAHCAQLVSTPLISLVLWMENVPQEWLAATFLAVRKQLYTRWELWILTPGTITEEAEHLLAKHRAEDGRIKGVWQDCSRHDVPAVNVILEHVAGEMVAFLEAGDVLAEHALYLVAVELNVHPTSGLIYSDEDKLNEQGERSTPYFKPDWNPDLFLEKNFVRRLGVYRTTLIRQIGGVRVEYGPNQEWDLALRLVEQLLPTQIRHIPRILCHCRARPAVATAAADGQPQAEETRHKVLRDYCARMPEKRGQTVPGLHGRWRVQYPLPEPPPLVSIIIPTKDRVELLTKCITSLYEQTAYKPFEIIIVNNQSTEAQTFAYFAHLVRERGVKVVCYDAPFNYAAINNFAVRYAAGAVLGFLNNDVEVLASGWLEEMVRHALRPEVGAVGALLYYPNDTIQHAGIIVGLRRGAGHAYAHCPRRDQGKDGEMWVTRNYSAVTAACLVVRRSVFEEVEGFDHRHLPVVFNDVDFCLRLREKGYWNVWTPYAELYHWESESRRAEISLRERIRFGKELTYFRQRWHEIICHDPAYNPNLSLAVGDFRLAWPPRVDNPWEAYEKGGNKAAP